jgi:hypothetical protein
MAGAVDLYNLPGDDGKLLYGTGNAFLLLANNHQCRTWFAEVTSQSQAELTLSPGFRQKYHHGIARALLLPIWLVTKTASPVSVMGQDLPKTGVLGHRDTGNRASGQKRCIRDA